MAEENKSLYGKDGIGEFLVMENDGLWVNDKMLFATILGVITALETVMPNIGELVSVISEKIYDHITEATAQANGLGSGGSDAEKPA